MSKTKDLNKKNAAKKPNIKFSEIRALEGRQDKGFEELCVQLLHELSGANFSQIDRIEDRGGDGGVEAIASTESGQNIGLQTKFFSKLGASGLTNYPRSPTS